MTDKREKRPSGAVELRFTGAESDEVKVSGYASVFNDWAEIAGLWEERVAPGAFDNVLTDDVRFLINHRDLPLARVSAGTMSLSVDERGLKMETELDPSDPDVARIVPKMKRGDLREMSIGFIVARDEWEHREDGSRRTILEVEELIDVSIVTTPAFPSTEIGLRSLEAAKADPAATKNSHDRRGRRMRMDQALADLS